MKIKVNKSKCEQIREMAFTFSGDFCPSKSLLAIINWSILNLNKRSRPDKSVFCQLYTRLGADFKARRARLVTDSID
jgi:hypothetical protein